MRADGETSVFLGAQSAYTTDPSFYYPKEHTLPALMPCFRLMDDEGVAVPGATLPEIDKETCVKMITTMVSVNEFDKVYNDAQRQGRLSFYFTNRGEEAVAVGTAAALKFTDWIWPQYRELGASFWRGITYEDAANQCCCSPAPVGKVTAALCGATAPLPLASWSWLSRLLAAQRTRDAPPSCSGRNGRAAVRL